VAVLGGQTGQDLCRPGSGGAVFHDPVGFATVRSSSFTRNSGPRGGALFAGGATIETSTFSDNSAVCLDSVTLSNIGSGGAVDARGSLSVKRSSFVHNSAGSLGGGAIAFLPFNASPLHVENSLFARNVASSGPDGVNVATVAAAGWVVATLTFSHAIAGHRAYVAATEERARRAEETREFEAERRVAEERLRIAREVHDVLAHTISVINVQAGVALYLVDEQPAQAREALGTIRSTSKEALAELRSLLGLLRPGDDAAPRAPAPGLAQLDSLVENATRAAEKGADISNSTTSAPSDRAHAALPSVELESTYTTAWPRPRTDARQRRSRSPSFRPIEMIPMSLINRF